MSITSERIRENCFIHHLMDAAADDIEALEQELATITKQRDLAVNALESIAGRRIFIDNLASNVDIAVMTLDAIKESEEN